MLRRRVLLELAQHVEHAVYGAGRLAAAVAQARQRVKGAVQIGGAVNEQQGFHAEALCQNFPTRFSQQPGLCFAARAPSWKLSFQCNRETRRIAGSRKERWI